MVSSCLCMASITVIYLSVCYYTCLSLCVCERERQRHRSVPTQAVLGLDITLRGPIALEPRTLGQQPRRPMPPPLGGLTVPTCAPLYKTPEWTFYACETRWASLTQPQLLSPFSSSPLPIPQPSGLICDGGEGDGRIVEVNVPSWGLLSSQATLRGPLKKR